MLCAVMSLAACRGQEEPAKAGQAAATESPERSVVASAAQTLFQSTGLTLEKGTLLDDAQLKQTGASRQERYTSQDPGLDILLLGYDDPGAAATALPTTASWANRSKALYKAEAMAEGDFVLLVGLSTGTEPTEDSKAVVDKLLNLFIGGAGGL
jgi:hypothetical protein